MVILHQILSADDGAWRDCLSFCREGDSILLAGQGACLLWDDRAIRAMGECAGPGRVVALAADTDARGLGLESGPARVRLLSDEEWLALACSHPKIMSWK